jgi:hypothetical protein
MGVFAIHEDGSVWKTMIGRGNASSTSWTPCEPRRIERENCHGYLSIRFCWEGVYSDVLAHRVVYRHFVGDIPEKHHINHKNGMKQDNCPSNLEAVTVTQNIRHAIDVLRRYVGERCHLSKLTNQDVRDIRECFKGSRGEIASLARKYHVDKSTMRQVVRGETWRHVNQGGAEASHVGK